MCYMQTAAYAPQKRWGIESALSSTAHSESQQQRYHDHSSLPPTGKEKGSHLKALSREVIYVTLMMKAVIQAVGPPPLSRKDGHSG